MLSDQEQWRRDAVEAEIQQVERLVEANADPKRLSMEWNKDVSSGEFTVRLILFTKSYVLVDGQVHLSSQHNLHIRIPRSYPHVAGLHIKIDSYRLFHPNIPSSGEFESRKSLEKAVLWLWDIFTFRFVDGSNFAPNQEALSWLKRHPGYREDLGFVAGLRPASPRHVADDQFKVKNKRDSGIEKNIKVTGERAYAASRSVDRGQAEERALSSPPASSSLTQGFRRKGLRVYQPQQLAFPEQLNTRDEWTYDPGGWHYRVPTQGYIPSRLKVVFLQSALTKIFQHATEISNIERFGILVGGVFSDAERAENWVEIVDMLPAERVHANMASVEVSHEEIARLNAKVDRILTDTGDIIRKIGWYHTHPGHGIFMSGTDKTNQEYCYTADWQVALVVDPIQHHYGAFSGSDCYALTNGVLVISDRNAARLNTPAFEAWQKIAHLAPDVLTPTVNLVPPSPSVSVPQEPTSADTRVPPPQTARGTTLADTTPDASIDSHQASHKLIIRQEVNRQEVSGQGASGQGVSGAGNEPTTQISTSGQPLVRRMDEQARGRRRNWRSVYVIVLCVFFILLIVAGSAIALTRRFNEDTTQLQALTTQLATTQQQLSSRQQNLVQTQDALLKQAKSVKDFSPLTYRKLLEAVVRMDRTSDSGKTAIQLLDEPVYYTVVAKDVFSTIAQRFGASSKALQNANPRVIPDQLQPGQVLTIPGEQVPDS